MYIGKFLNLHRKNKGYTTKQLADRAKVGQSSISEIENNKISPTIETLDKILIALEISFTEFFSSIESIISDQITSKEFFIDGDLTPELITLLNSAKKLTPNQLDIINRLLEALVSSSQN